MTLMEVVDGCEAEHLLGAVVAAKLNHFGNASAFGESLYLDDDLNGVADLRGNVITIRLLMCPHSQLAKAMQRTERRTGVDCGHRPCVAGVEGIEQVARLRSTYLAKNDAVWSPAQRTLEQGGEVHNARMSVRLALCGEQVWLCDLEVGRVLDDDEPLSRL